MADTYPSSGFPGSETDLAAQAAAKLKAEADAKAAAVQNGVEKANSYGISQALLAAYPELQTVYDLFKSGDTGKAVEALQKTKYYTELSTTVKTRMKAKTEQNGVYLQQLDSYSMAARKRLVTSGVKIDKTAFDTLVQRAYDTGMDDNQLDEAILFSGKMTGFGGNVLGSTEGLKAYAESYGVGNYLLKPYWDQKSKDLFAGTTTIDDIQKEIRDQSASAFPAYADKLSAGVSLDMIASSYKGAMATILEKDANSFDYTDPRLRSALQSVDKDGKPVTKPLWQFEKELRSTPEWQYTNNARDSIDSMQLKVMQDWGIM
jgi:hypothetical protein